jgi:hypothetical protein
MDMPVLDRPATSAAYPIPDIALDDRLGWIGTSGSGKTYNAGGGVERLLATGARVIIVDPLDVWWGLRLTAEGKPSRFTLPIFGGEHGDLPLNENAGKLIGETVAGMAESCIVSLGGLETKSAERRFMLAFLEAVYRHATNNPVHIIFDEADLWAPQKSLEPKLQALMEQIVRRGRIRGFIPWLITQRPAVLSKDVLSQVDGLIAFKLTSSQDRDALGAWIEGQADRQQGKEILASLPTLQRGEGVVWVPGRHILTTASFPTKRTFDSSRTPSRGERVEKRELKPLDLEGLKGRLASIEEDAKANDPTALKAEVARLTRELAKAEKAKAAPPQIVHANAEEIEKARSEGEAVGYSNGLAAAVEAIRALGKGQRTALSVQPRRAVAMPAIERVPEAPVIAAAGLTQPQQKILNALAWWQAFGIDRPTNEQVGFIAGYSPGSGNFNNLKGQLRSFGLIDYPQGGRVSLTDAGDEKAEAPAIEVTRAEFHRHVRAKLSGPQLKLFDPVLAAYPGSMTSDGVAEAAGYSAGSGNFNNLRGQLRSIGLIEYPRAGEVRAADWLFP